MQPIATGFVVVRADLDEAVVPAGRDYDVGEDGTLTFRSGRHVVATFPAGEWVEVRRIGRPLRATWPPDDLDRVIDNVLEALVVGQGWVMWGLRRERFIDPAYNELDPFVDAVLEADGLVPGLDSDNRRTALAIVARAFGIEESEPERRRRT